MHDVNVMHIDDAYLKLIVQEPKSFLVYGFDATTTHFLNV
jgi:hypothetical protein